MFKDKVNDVKYKVGFVVQCLCIEFNIEINDIINEELILGMLEEEIVLKVDCLCGCLENYGEINFMAVEVFDEMKEWVENIIKQWDDIFQAKLDLEIIIKEIEEMAILQFLEFFEKACLYFIDVFCSLFIIEDICDLILMDFEDLLELKIEIVVKFKGK